MKHTLWINNIETTDTEYVLVHLEPVVMKKLDALELLVDTHLFRLDAEITPAKEVEAPNGQQSN
jgi:hypothetical protein